MTAVRGSAWALFLIAAVAAGCATGGGRSSFATGEPGDYAHRLMARRCQNCHSRPRPEAMAAEKWQAALGRMHKKVRLETADWDSLAALASVDSSAHAAR